MAVATPAPQRAAGRRKLAKQRKALPDGSFPIPNVDYLGRAIRAVGRAAPGKRPALSRLIRKRARQLGSAGMARLKGSWADNTQSTKAMANALYGQLIELGFAPEVAKAETQATISFMLIELATPVVGSIDGPRVTTLAGRSAKLTPAQKKPNDTSRKAWDPDSDGDSDDSPTGDVDNDYAGKLNMRQRAVMRGLLKKGWSPKKAYSAACKVGGGMGKAA